MVSCSSEAGLSRTGKKIYERREVGRLAATPGQDSFKIYDTERHSMTASCPHLCEINFYIGIW